MSKPSRAPRHGPPDAPVAHDPERRAVHVAAQQQLGLPGHPLARAARRRSPSASRRAAARSSAQARSAVVSVSTPGVLPTGIPRAAGGLEVDVVGAHGVVGDRPQLGARRRSASASRRSVSRESSPSHPFARASSSSCGGGSALRPDLDLVRRAQAIEGVPGQPSGHEASSHRGGRLSRVRSRAMEGGRTRAPDRGHVALVANAGSGGGLEPEEIARELERAGARVESFDLGELEAAVASRPARLVIASGDGAIGAAAAAAAGAGIPLAVVPAGTANDFARAMRRSRRHGRCLPARGRAAPACAGSTCAPRRAALRQRRERGPRRGAAARAAPMR